MPQCSVPKCQNKYYAQGFCGKHYQRNRKFGDPLAGHGNHAPPEERFWRHVVKGLGCWVYSGGSAKAKYGLFQRHNRGDVVLAHRYSYELHIGKIPAGKIVMHICDNPRCVNPKHLSVGTHKENTQDMIAKGRHARVAPLGTDNGKAKLTPAKVRAIRASADTNKALADRWGLSVNCIRGVRIGRTWAHIK